MTRWLVVGAGAAGCVVAARLSEDESNDVTLLEAGRAGRHDGGEPGEPHLDDPELLDTDVSVVRHPVAQPEPYALGRGLGGSSLVNPGVVVGDPAHAGDGHDLPVAPASHVGPVGRAVLEATDDAAVVSLVGNDGRRVTVADAYLAPVADRANLHVVTGARVDCVRFEGRRAVGVTTTGGVDVDADRVVLAAGAIGTPTILVRSGVDTPGVGERLQDHAGVAISFELADPQADVPAIGVTVERPGRQIVVMDRVPGNDRLGAVIAGRLAIASEGRITLPDRDGPPLVELGQLTDISDLEGLVEVVREAIELLDAAPMRSVIGECYVDEHGTSLGELTDDAALRDWLPRHLGGYHHVAGSCRRGTVVDDHGALIGYEGVLLCDASVLPGVPRRNPYVTVVRHAEVAVARWRAA